MFANVLALVFALLCSQLVNVVGVPSPAADPSADLGGLSIGDIINALGIGLVQNISAIITLESLTDNLIEQVSFNFLSLASTESVTNESVSTSLVYFFPSELSSTVDPAYVAKNPLIIELTLDKVSSLAGVNNTVYASFDHTFDPPVVVRPLDTANSGTIDNVLLVQGAINSLNIIPLGELDLLDVNVSVRAATIDGFGGIPIPIDGLKQSDVPTT
ncbi:hypothetical protein DFH05DRAFT_1523433 [Lentinula detonsa]|uniref:Uncharacterized protein n=1 Tax=Lentinula detonsa TaxID=2804962 RepID=A0A9W8TZK2_9AGAR|nr:hypothetical protein DFH05DRAFT_1523433 [Lentinula detonsa]